MVSFASPDALWLLVLPLAAAVFAVRRHLRRLHQQRRLASPGVWDRVMGGSPATGLLRMLAWCAAGAMIALALARPQWGELPSEESVRTRDLVVAVDVSDSMLCPDLRPSRLVRGLEVIRQVLPAVEGNRVGVVVFAGEAYPLVPLTTDLSAVAVFLDGIQPGMVGLPGSNLEAAGAAALKLMLGDGEGRVVILMTDGENLQGNVEAAARSLKDAGVGVLAVVAGTENGGPIPVETADGSVQYKRDAGGQPVVTRAQPEVLRQIAALAGGEVLDLADRDVVPKLVAAVDELRTREVEATRTVRRFERFQVFLAVAAALLVVGFALGPWRRLAAAAMVILCSVSMPAAAQQTQGASTGGAPVIDSPPAEAEPPTVPWWQRLIPGVGAASRAAAPPITGPGISTERSGISLPRPPSMGTSRIGSTTWVRRSPLPARFRPPTPCSSEPRTRASTVRLTTGGPAPSPRVRPNVPSSCFDGRCWPHRTMPTSSATTSWLFD